MINPASRPADQPGWYQIRLAGQLAPRWAARLDGMRLTAQADGTTSIEGPVVDQAALHGLLHTLRDIGLPLLSISQIDHPTRSTRTQEMS